MMSFIFLDRFRPNKLLTRGGEQPVDLSEHVEPIFDSEAVKSDGASRRVQQIVMPEYYSSRATSLEEIFSNFAFGDTCLITICEILFLTRSITHSSVPIFFSSSTFRV